MRQAWKGHSQQAWRKCTAHLQFILPSSRDAIADSEVVLVGRVCLTAFWSHKLASSTATSECNIAVIVKLVSSAATSDMQYWCTCQASLKRGYI